MQHTRISPADGRSAVSCRVPPRHPLTDHAGPGMLERARAVRRPPSKAHNNRPAVSPYGGNVCSHAGSGWPVKRIIGVRQRGRQGSRPSVSESTAKQEKDTSLQPRTQPGPHVPDDAAE